MTGKLVVARADQRSYIENLHHKSLRLQWPPHSDTRGLRDGSGPVLPTRLLSGGQALEMEPDLSHDIAAALWCPQTGIIDSHALMVSLEKDIIDSPGGELVYSTRVVRVDPYEPSRAAEGTPDIESTEDGWVIQTVTGDASDGDALLARTLINASGLSSTLVLNSVLPESQRLPMYYARGSYASYHGPGISHVSHLIYPCPETGPDAHAFHSLGTHLTLDLQGKVRFGPDVEWISAPSTENPEEGADFWAKHLIPDGSRLSEMHKAVASYLPGVVLENMQPDYVGMRPKLVPPQGGFKDFTFRFDHSSGGTMKAPGDPGTMISLLGIESPGLTSSLAIAEYVVDDILGADGQAY